MFYKKGAIDNFVSPRTRLFDFQMRAALRHTRWRGDIGHVDLTGEDGYFLCCIGLVVGISLVVLEFIALWKDIVANDFIVVGGEGLALLHVDSVGIVCQATHLYGRFDEFVDGGIHIELQESGYIYVAF